MHQTTVILRRKPKNLLFLEENCPSGEILRFAQDAMAAFCSALFFIKKGAHVVSAKSGNDAGFVGIKI